MEYLFQKISLLQGHEYNEYLFYLDTERRYCPSELRELCFKVSFLWVDLPFICSQLNPLPSLII